MQLIGSFSSRKCCLTCVKIIPRVCVDLGNVSSAKKKIRARGEKYLERAGAAALGAAFPSVLHSGSRWKRTLFSSLNAPYLAALGRAVVAGGKTRFSAMGLAEMLVLVGMLLPPPRLCPRTQSKAWFSFWGLGSHAASS